jgi:hypothetical protein
MAKFKLIKGRFTSEIEYQLNKLSEQYHKVEVQCITFDYNINQYTLVVVLENEILPMTYYNPIDDQYYIV